MFREKPAAARRKATTAIAEVIWRAFKGKIEVEVYIGDLDGTGKTLRHPALKTFVVDGQQLEVEYVKTDDQIAPGVIGDDYIIVDDSEKDLAIISVEPGCQTPLQRILKGTRTIEGYVSGKGKLTVISIDGEIAVYPVEPGKSFSTEVHVGDLMQWEAAPDSVLVFSEVCYPPYADDRYENIT
jgi:hypothetical protein